MSIFLDISSYEKNNNWKKYVILNSGQLKDIFVDLASKNYELYKKFFNDKGQLKSYINICYKGRIINRDEYKKLIIKNGEKIKFIIPIAGG